MTQRNNFRTILERMAKEELKPTVIVKEATEKPVKVSVMKLIDITKTIRDASIKIKQETPVKNGIEISFFNNNDRDKAKILIPNKVDESDKLLTFYLV